MLLGRAKSTADLVSKLAIVEEEADESIFWIDLLIDSEIVPENRLGKLRGDIEEIVKMTVASIKTLRMKQTANPKSKTQNPK